MPASNTTPGAASNTTVIIVVYETAPPQQSPPPLVLGPVTNTERLLEEVKLVERQMARVWESMRNP